MNLDEIKEILDMMREHELAEFELERNGVKLRLRKQGAASWDGVTPAPPVTLVSPVPVASGASATMPAEVAHPPVLTAAGDDMDLAIVKSPIVGTFYRATEPGAKPFVDLGDAVRKGHVLCIIEAMKLMNEINSECEGEIVKIYVENGQPVQYGERLFAIRPT